MENGQTNATSNETVPVVNQPEPLDVPTLSNRGTITIGKTLYAVGLMWQPLQNPDDPLEEIRETMESDPDANLYCLRNASSPQYGLGKTSLGHREGEPSAAAAVAAAYIDKTSVCAVFRVKEGWWFVAIRNDLILSEEDVLFTTEEEAQKAFFAMMAVPDWDVKIAPETWQIEGTKNVDLVALVKNTRKLTLVKLNASQRIKFFLFLAVLIFLFAGAVIYIILGILNMVTTQEKITQMPIPEVITPVEPAPERPKPWEKIADVNVLLDKCWNNSYQLSSITIPGWTMGTVSCTYKGISTSWSKSWPRAGRIAWLKAALDEYKLAPKVDVKLGDNGTSATGDVVFTDIPYVASPPRLSERQLWEDLTDIQQATGLGISISKQTILDPPNNEDGTVPPNQQQYVYYSFTVSSPYTPWEWRTFFEKFPGLELTKIEFNPGLNAGNKWKYEGRIYAK